MKKASLFLWIVKIFMGGIALGVGIWYLSSSIGGGALTYSSMNTFLNAVGVEDGNIANANGCFLCQYINQLFDVMGGAAAKFWDGTLDTLLLLIALGFGIYIIYTGVAHVWDATKKTAGPKVEEKKIEFKPWFDKIWKQAVRVIIVSVLLAGGAAGGIATLQAITQIIMTPTLYLGGVLGMAASGIADSATCAIGGVVAADNFLAPALGPFMCVIGNINSVVLAGAAGGFAMMNYAWMGMGGGIWTWLAGLGLVIMFLVIGFDLFFQIISVVFKLLFLIIFLPIFVAAFAFEGGWKLASGLLDNGIKMILNATIKTIVIALKTVIIYAAVSYTADSYFPGPVDGYSVMLPPLLQQNHTGEAFAGIQFVKDCERVATINNRLDSHRYQLCMDQKIAEYDENTENRQTLSVMRVFSDCEQESKGADGLVDKDDFKACFESKKAIVEQQYPNAFNFLDDGWDFLLMMGTLFALYMLVLRSKIENMLPKIGDEDFEFGGTLKKLGKNIWSIPKKAATTVGKAIDEKVI